jgi:hypothetical protein
MSTPDPRTDFATATRGFDPQFRDALADRIITAIGMASVVRDAPVMAIRTTETVDALRACLVATLALVPSRLRETVEALAKRIPLDVARARAEGVGVILGARKGGSA